jgi:hypothetical protein
MRHRRLARLFFAVVIGLAAQAQNNPKCQRQGHRADHNDGYHQFILSVSAPHIYPLRSLLRLLEA